LEEEKKSLERRINMYRITPRLQPLLGEVYIPQDLSNLSHAALKRLYQEIQDQMNVHFREKYVEGFFKMSMEGIEKGCEFFIKGVEWQGMAEMATSDECIEQFQPELSQIAIELSDNMIPGPKSRLTLKMLQFIKTFYDLHKSKQQQEQ